MVAYILHKGLESNHAKVVSHLSIGLGMYKEHRDIHSILYI